MVSEVQQTQNQPAVVYQHTGCCGNFVKNLPEKYRKACYAMGIILLLNGVASLIVGIVGFFTTSHRAYNYQYHYYYYFMNPTVHNGANIWSGIFVSSSNVVIYKYT